MSKKDGSLALDTVTKKPAHIQMADGIDHAYFTIRTLERLLEKRGSSTRGKTKWELQLLYSAYNVVGTPKENRKFGLNEIDDIKDIRKPW